MKKFISALLIVSVLLSFAACGKKDTPVEPAAPTAETVAPAGTAQPVVTETVPEETVPQPIYHEVLDAYYDALLQGFGPEECQNKGLNYLVGMEKDINKVGYCIDDLNGDGTPELMIGKVGGSDIWAMYTMVGEEIVQVIDGGERNVYWLQSDGGIVNRGSNSAASSAYWLYTFDGTKLVLQDGLIFDAEADAENPWFYTTEQEWDTANAQPIDTQEAEIIVEQLEDSQTEIGYVAFAEYNN